jgi:hypothetical protein
VQRTPQLPVRDTERAAHRGRVQWPRIWVSGIVLRTALLVPVALATEPQPSVPHVPPQAPAPQVAPGAPQVQKITGEEVEIEGKLYSPQTLFIVARPRETFGRDAVVPHYLQLVPSSQLLPYQLRIVPAVAVDTTAAEPARAIPASTEAAGSP